MFLHMCSVIDIFCHNLYELKEYLYGQWRQDD
jgi:hypothetical protein